MSLPTYSVTRTPLKDISSSQQQYSQSGTPQHHQPLKSVVKSNTTTPKTSPGPALLHGIKLSAKKNLLKIPNIAKGVAEANTPKPKDRNLMSEELEGVLRFRNLLSSETIRITEMCHRWDKILEDSQERTAEAEIPGDFVVGEIWTTVGQARLIMKERFHQFEGLVDNCEFGTSEKVVTCQDLQGFWDMIYFQVEDVDRKFALLKKCQSCKWDEKCLKPDKAPSSVKKTKKRIVNKPFRAKPAAAKVRNPELARKKAEARKRLMAAKAEMMKSQEQADQKTFDAGFFKVESPVKSSKKTVELLNVSHEFSSTEGFTATIPPNSPNASPATESSNLTHETAQNEGILPLGCGNVVAIADGCLRSDGPNIEITMDSNEPAVTDSISEQYTELELNFHNLAISGESRFPDNAHGDGPGTGCHLHTPKCSSSAVPTLAAYLSPWVNISMSEFDQSAEGNVQKSDVIQGGDIHNNTYVAPVHQSKSPVRELHDPSPSTVTSTQDAQTNAVYKDGSCQVHHNLVSPQTLCSRPANEVSLFADTTMAGLYSPDTPLSKQGVNVSVLIDNAAKNIEMASELLNETPRRMITGTDKRIQSVVDQGTSFSPPCTPGS